MVDDQDWHDITYASGDGLRLYARDYGGSIDGRVPAVCLSGLTRTSREFHMPAMRLAQCRRVICPDYRGRGRSQHASDWQTYMPVNEMADVVALLDLLEVERAVVIGTSRGGIIAMLMAMLRRDRLAGVVLNDIGPVIEPEGLLRIVQYVGQTSTFDDWPQAVVALKQVNVGFDALSDAEWDYFARFTFAEKDGKPFTDFDPALGKTMPDETQIMSGEAPELWPAFSGFDGLPGVVVRGEHSDLLSEATMAEMTARVGTIRAVTIADRGHTPFLTEPEAVAAIEDVLYRADRD